MRVETDEDRARRRFDPILRQLLAAQLVVSGTTGDGTATWRLTAAAAERLALLAGPAPADDKVVYFSRHCERCGQRRPTRHRHDQYVCEECWSEARLTEVTAHPDGLTA
ncbi:MAG TPA: hypothetical protein VKG43_05740 [Acidimicrobiales bacterium]|nr:hypothetical protein [Acidimicrobiales bacterium]